MTDWDEQLEYFVILSHLLSEADLQLQAGENDAAARIYADDLHLLRKALGSAVDAATTIIARVHMQQSGRRDRPPSVGGTVARLPH